MKSDMEYAALVMGASWNEECQEFTYPKIDGNMLVECTFNALHDDGDSRRLEIACNKWTNTNGAEADTICDAHWNYVESWGECDPQAIRAAVFALAVEIGKTIEGKDNAKQT